MELIRTFWEEEEGSMVMELLVAMAALMCVALLFRDKLTKFATKLMENVFPDAVQDEVKVEIPK